MIILFALLIQWIVRQCSSTQYEFYAATLTLISGSTSNTENTVLSLLNLRRCKKTNQWIVLPESDFWYMEEHKTFSSYAEWYILPAEQVRLVEKNITEKNTISLPLILDLATIQIAK
jgi:hypothetical protein